MSLSLLFLYHRPFMQHDFSPKSSIVPHFCFLFVPFRFILLAWLTRVAILRNQVTLTDVYYCVLLLFLLFFCYVCLLLRWLNECKRCYNRGLGCGEGWVFRWCRCPVLWLTQSICLLQTKPFTTTEICYIGYNKRYVYIKLFYKLFFFLYSIFPILHKLTMYFKGTKDPEYY